jgi:AraC-like DNA-binding protein
MSDQQQIVPSRYTAPLLNYLAECEGHSLGSVLMAHGFEADRLHSSDAALTIEEFDRLMQILQAHTGRTDLGFEFGLHLTMATHGPLGQTMSNCENIGELLNLACRFSKLITPGLSLKYIRGRNHHEFLWRPAAGMSKSTLQNFYELHVTSLYVLLDSLLGDRLIPYEVWIPMERPLHVSRYKSLCKLRPHFEISPFPEVKTIIPIALANCPLNNSKSATAPNIDDLYKIQERLEKGICWTDWVTLMLRECENCQPSQEELAELMNISAHTLARRLKGEGVSFRDLANQIRHQRACELIHQRRLSLEQIAQRLGYEQLSNFSHAFSKMEGISPSIYRKNVNLS